MIKNEGGFTILETMIVMIVTSVMLVSTMATFSGQHKKTQFAQALRDLESKFDDIANDVSTGYFPNSNSISCSAVGVSEPNISAVSTEQGANYDCIFLGKAVVLHDGGSDNFSLQIYPIVGNRNAGSLSGATFGSTRPKAVGQLVEEKSLLYGTRIKSIQRVVSGASLNGSGALIVIASTPNGTGATLGGGFNSGLQRINAYSSGSGGVSISMTSTVSDTEVTSSMQSVGLVWPASDVVLCLESDPGTGLNRSYGGIVVSGGQNGVSARLQLPADGVQCT